VGHFLIGRRLRGLVFFALANFLFLSTLATLAFKFYLASRQAPLPTPDRWLRIREIMAAQGPGVLWLLGCLYGLLLLVSVLDAWRQARRVS
jgi:hypothetical protein